MSVKVSNISKSYGKQTVVRDVSFDINPGEIVSFLGPNGAGKSTCLKIITGWLTPDSGNVSICGYDIAKDSIAAKRRMGYLPENNPLYPELYVKEYLEYIAGIYQLKNTRQRITEIAARLKIDDVMGKTIGTLSKGYKQRVGLAQAILHDPDVILLDEPFTGLDPNQLEEAHSLIRELGREKAILYSSHSLPEVAGLSDRTIIINHGNIVANATTKELTYNRPLEEIFKELTR